MEKLSQTDAQRLADMSLHELWELFPVFLVEPNDEWNRRYARMEGVLTEALGDMGELRISHVGSTAIRDIRSKDIVDVLVEFDPERSLPAAASVLESLGFIRMADSPIRISLNCGYTPEGFADEVFHIHLRYRGDNDELYFRDYLNEHPSVAREYEALKVGLCAEFEHDRDAYTSGKDDFVCEWSAKAREAYGNLY